MFLAVYFMTAGFVLASTEDHHLASGCPAAPNVYTMLCQVNAIDSGSVLQNIFLVVVPVLLMVSICAVVSFVLFRYWDPSLLVVSFSAHTDSTEKAVVPLFRKLFSDGILNPKLF